LLDLTPRHVLIQNNRGEIVKEIEKFRGQKIELDPCGKFGDETHLLYGAIVDVLGKAKWDMHVVTCTHVGYGVPVIVNTLASRPTMDAANRLGRVLTKFLRTFSSDTFDRFDKLFEQRKGDVWYWIMPLLPGDPPLDRETIRVRIMSEF
jgi:hypothetical protein